GDSPMGYRLPLDSQPWVAQTDYPRIHAPDQSQQFPPLPAYRVLQQSVQEQPEVPQGDPLQAPGKFVSASSIARTALCAQPRDGRLHIFMPPTSELEDYLELVAAIEATA